MELFSNWMFWVILAAILFILAIIGYLSESKKKSKKKEVSNETSSNNSVDNSAVSPKTVETPVQVQTTSQNDNFTVMPEVKVETLNDVEPTEPTPAPATSVVNENVVTDKVPDVTPTTSSEPAAMPSSNNQNNNNVWNS